MFKDLFEIKNTYTLEDEMNSQAIPYYKELITKGIDNKENCKYFLLCLDRLYQEGFVSPLRDFEYDNALEIFLDNGGEMIRGDMSSGDKAIHVYPNLKGTIKKVHYISEEDRLAHSKVQNHKSLENWLNGVVSELEAKGIWHKELTLGFYTKYDGLSVILEVEDGKVRSAITRGDKELGTGQDKTGLFKYYDFKDECKLLGTKKFGLKCEALVSFEGFTEYNKKFGDNKLVDPRSAATSILNSDNPTKEELSYLILKPLVITVKGKDYPLPNEEVEAFDSWLEDTVSFILVGIKSVSDAIKKAELVVKEMVKLIAKLDVPADGIVIRIENEDYKKALGRNTDECINNFERAYKFPPATAKTTLRGIEQEIGLLGKVSFTAKINPVKLKNKTIKSISLGSYARFKDLQLAEGDEVYVRYDIIPYLTVEKDCKKSGKPVIEAITKCPYCGQPLEFNPELSCTNNNCKSRMIGKIYNYCAKMNIEGIGEETVTTLFNHGFITNIIDLYKLENEAEQLKNLTGFGNKMIENIVQSIKKADKVAPHILLGSIGIPSVSRRLFKKILGKYSFEEVIGFTDKDIKKLCEVEGIKSKMAKKVITGIKENYDLIRELLKYVKVKEEKEKKYKASVCFTKIRNKEFEKFLENQGILVMDNLNKETDLLITGSGTSSKMEKAKKLGIPMMSIGDAYQHFGFSV